MPILHRNFNSISRFIIKHDEYSNYEANVHVSGTDEELKANFGAIVNRRRYLKKRLISNPFSPFLYFIYMYILRAGFIDGKAGFFYILYQSIYMYFVSSKMCKLKHKKKQFNTMKTQNQKNKKLLITGGTGSFGNAVLKRFLNQKISMKFAFFSG